MCLDSQLSSLIISGCHHSTHTFMELALLDSIYKWEHMLFVCKIIIVIIGVCVYVCLYNAIVFMQKSFKGKICEVGYLLLSLCGFWILNLVIACVVSSFIHWTTLLAQFLAFCISLNVLLSKLSCIVTNDGTFWFFSFEV